MIEKTTDNITYKDLIEYNINDIVLLKKLYSKRKMLWQYLTREEEYPANLERDFSDKIFVIISKTPEVIFGSVFHYDTNINPENGKVMSVLNERVLYELESTDLSIQLKNIHSFLLKKF